MVDCWKQCETGFVVVTARLGFFVVVLADETPVEHFSGVSISAVAADDCFMNGLTIQRAGDAFVTALSISL